MFNNLLVDMDVRSPTPPLTRERVHEILEIPMGQTGGGKTDDGAISKPPEES